MPEMSRVGVPNCAVFSYEEPGSNVTQGCGLSIKAPGSQPVPGVACLEQKPVDYGGTAATILANS